MSSSDTQFLLSFTRTVYYRYVIKSDHGQSPRAKTQQSLLSSLPRLCNRSHGRFVSCARPLVSSEDTGRAQRRSPRIVATIPLDVQPVEESCATAVINLHGALILSPVPWPAGTLLNMRNQKNQHSIQARVVWTGPQEASGSYKLGVEFEEPESGFWGNDYSLAAKT